jgi:hypothetical protein
MKCKKCKIEMVRGIAIVNTPRASYDELCDGEPHDVTMSMDGPAQLIDCRKCPVCGKSFQ